MSTTPLVPQPEPAHLDTLDTLDSLDVCPICHEPPRDPMTTHCGHTMCKICMERMIQHNIDNNLEVLCPMCREVLLRPVEIPTASQGCNVIHVNIDNVHIHIGAGAATVFSAFSVFTAFLSCPLVVSTVCLMRNTRV